MIKLVGSGSIATWRPYEEGRGGAQMRASERECETVMVYDYLVTAQHKDGFWETCHLGNCAISWKGKPLVFQVNPNTGEETRIEMGGNDDSLGDHFRFAARKTTASWTPMESTTEAIEG